MAKYIKLSVGWCRKVKDLDDLWSLYEEGGRRIVYFGLNKYSVYSAGFVAHWTYAKLVTEWHTLYVIEDPKPTIWDKIRNFFAKR